MFLCFVYLIFHFLLLLDSCNKSPLTFGAREFLLTASSKNINEISCVCFFIDENLISPVVIFNSTDISYQDNGLR